MPEVRPEDIPTYVKLEQLMATCEENIRAVLGDVVFRYPRFPLSLSCMLALPFVVLVRRLVLCFITITFVVPSS